MSRESGRIVESIRTPVGVPISATDSLLDCLIFKKSRAAERTLNNLINVCSTLILVAILVSLELHIRRSLQHRQRTSAELEGNAQHGGAPRVPPILLSFAALPEARSGQKRQLNAFAAPTSTNTKVSIRWSNCVSSTLLP